MEKPSDSHKDPTSEKVLKTYGSFVEMITDKDPKPRGLKRLKSLYSEAKEALGTRKYYPGLLSWASNYLVPYRLRMWYYEVLYRTTDKYHVVKLKGLKPGYYDYPDRILHANFQLLCDYVETERDRIRYAIEDDEPTSREYSVHLKEIMDLHNWWTNKRPKREETKRWDHRAEAKRLGIKAPPDTVQKIEQDGQIFYRTASYDSEDYADYVNLMKTITVEELDRQKEDEDNLVRLVKVRQYISG